MRHRYNYRGYESAEKALAALRRRCRGVARPRLEAAFALGSVLYTRAEEVVWANRHLPAQELDDLVPGLRGEFPAAGVAVVRDALTWSHRSGRSRGPVLGHRFGIGSDVLLGYREPRFLIYLPAYRWVLENRQAEQVELRGLLRETTLVLPDYETNEDVDDSSVPLPDAALVKYHLEDLWPVTEGAG